MKRKQEKSKPRVSEPPKRKSVRDIAVLVGFFALPVILVVWIARRPAQLPSGTSGQTSISASSSSNQSPVPLKSVSAANLAATSTPAQQANVSANASSTPVQVSNPIAAASTPSTRPELPGDPKQLVAMLSEVDFSGPSVPADQAAQWKQAFQKLVQQGAAAVPAIREFLAKNMDVDFDSSKGGDLGYPTLRLALFDLLRQIGGTESVAASVQVLQSTADPREIAILSKNLEQQEPSKHRQEAVGAAREALAQAARGQLEGHDLGPLFEVLQQYGGSNVAADLEQVAAKWNFYATIALGALPAGAGLPSLVRMTHDSSIQNVMAFRILAQIAGKYPEAREALVAQVRSNTMPYSAWAGVQAALGGEIIEYGAPLLVPGTTSSSSQTVRSYHINYGNQNYRTLSVSADWTEDQIKQQVAVIDAIIAVDANLETLQFLQDARLGLAARLKK